MYKIFVLLFLVFNVYAQDNFQETRYIYAIDKNISYEGKIDFLQNSIDIIYAKPKEQKVTYLQDDEDFQKKSFYLILKAIHDNDEALLKEYFEIKKDDEKTVLIALGILKDYIRQVDFKKQENILEFIKIQMQNDDWILIETVL